MNNAGVLEQILAIIEEAEAMRGAYYYTPPSHAGARRSYERQHTRPEVQWEEGGHVYTARYDVTCSCRNVYARGAYTRDGKPTTLTAVKNSYRRMKEG